MSFLIALGASSLFAAFKESMDNSVRSTDQLRQIIKAPVLASVSYIMTSNEKKMRYTKKISWAFLILGTIGLCLYFANQYVVKLDYLWSVILNRIKMIV